MSAPDTNLKTQKRRHRGPLIGIGLAVVFAVSIILYWVFQEVATTGNPQGADTRTEGAPSGEEGALPPTADPVTPMTPPAPEDAPPTAPADQDAAPPAPADPDAAPTAPAPAE